MTSIYIERKINGQTRVFGCDCRKMGNVRKELVTLLDRPCIGCIKNYASLLPGDSGVKTKAESEVR